MTFQLVQSAHPYYYHCIHCYKELIVRGSVELTEKLRMRGLCDACLSEFHLALTNKQPIIFVKAPWANAGQN